MTTITQADANATLAGLLARHERWAREQEAATNDTPETTDATEEAPDDAD